MSSTMTREQKIEHAEQLRSQGLTYRDIAALVDTAENTVYCWLNPDYAERNRARSRAWKARNKSAVREHDRAYDEAHKGRCRECGNAVNRRRDGCICMPCREDKRDCRARQIERLWAEGRSLKEIAAELGCTVKSLGVRMVALRKMGYDLPHRYKVRNGKRVVA